MNCINNIINNLNFGLAEQSKLSVKCIRISENKYGDKSIFFSILKDGKKIVRDFEVESINEFSDPYYLKKLVNLISEVFK